MPLLNDMDKVYLGSQLLDAVYMGADKLWPPAQASGAPVGPAVLAGQDGDWLSRGWGKSGYVISDGSSATTSKNPPSGVTYSCNGPEYSWNPSTQHTSGMIHSNGADRVQCCWYGTPMDMSLTFAQAWSGTVRFYFLSQANDDRSESVTAFHNGVQQGTTLNLMGNDPTTWYGSGMMTTTMLPGGRWVAYDLNMAAGDVFKLGMILVGGANVVLTGMVFDAAPLWDSATSAYMAATGLDQSYTPVLNDLVVGLKSKGLWSKMKAVYPFIGGTAALHKWNLMDPRDTDDAYRLTFTGGTHSASLGYRANEQGQQIGSPRYANTHFIPRGVLNQDSTHLSFYSLLDVPSADRAEMGCFNWTGTSGSRFHIIARYAGVNAYYYGMSEEGTSNIGVPAASGLFATTRTAVNVQTGYRNGVKVSAGINNNPSIALPPTPVYIGAINEFANRSDIPCGFASIGDGLDAQNVADLYTVVQSFQTALGRQI